MVDVGLIVDGLWAGGVGRYGVDGDDVLCWGAMGQMGLQLVAGWWLCSGVVDGWEVHFHGGL